MCYSNDVQAVGKLQIVRIVSELVSPLETFFLHAKNYSSQLPLVLFERIFSVTSNFLITHTPIFSSRQHQSGLMEKIIPGDSPRHRLLPNQFPKNSPGKLFSIKKRLFLADHTSESIRLIE
jgi:hypothetical protein